jgi:dihydrofolate reductase
MVNIIVGMTGEGVIGKDGGLPWHIPEDLKNFKRLTSGQVVVMGRKTYQSLPEKFRPLPDRHNVVISTSMKDVAGIDICASIETGLQKAKSYGKEIFIIGGSTIFKQFMPLTKKMYISEIKQNYTGDTYFPKFNKEEWEIEDKQEFNEFFLKVMKKL